MIKFGQLYAEPSRNGIYKSREHYGDGVKIVNMGELFAYDVISDQEMRRLRMTATEMTKSGLADGDLLFGRRSLVESGAGKCSLVEGLSEPTTFESSIIRVRVNESLIRPRFVFYWLKSPGGAGRVRAIVTGTNVKGIRGTVLKTIQMACPPIDVQDTIVSTLRAYDDLIENNRQRIQLLEEAARLLYREWFVHLRFPGHEHVRIVDGVPEGWENKSLGEIAATNIENYTPRTLSDEINYIDISSVNQGRIATKNTISSSKAPGRARRKARSGDIIWSNVRPNLRAFALVIDPKENDVFSTGFTIISPIAVPFSYLYLFVTTDEFVGYLVNHTTGASYPAVRSSDFERAMVPVPPKRMLDLFHEKAEPIYRLISILEEESKSLAQARNLLLPRLMNGEIAV